MNQEILPHEDLRSLKTGFSCSFQDLNNRNMRYDSFGCYQLYRWYQTRLGNFQSSSEGLEPTFLGADTE